VTASAPAALDAAVVASIRSSWTPLWSRPRRPRSPPPRIALDAAVAATAVADLDVRVGLDGPQQADKRCHC
jgi:hypothetical protein